MDFLIELIMGLLFEVPVEVAMESKKLKTGIKTGIFCVIGGLVELLFIFLTVIAWQNNDFTSRFFVTAITVAWIPFVIFGAIHGHKRKWKNS